LRRRETEDTTPVTDTSLFYRPIDLYAGTYYDSV